MSGSEHWQEAPATKTITYSRVVDLSHTVHSGIPQWPGDPPVEFQEVATPDRDGYYLRRFSMGEHSATHMNAPSSFHAEGMAIDAYPPESMVAPAVVLDVRARAMLNADYCLDITGLAEWEEKWVALCSASGEAGLGT